MELRSVVTLFRSTIVVLQMYLVVQLSLSSHNPREANYVSASSVQPRSFYTHHLSYVEVRVGTAFIGLRMSGAQLTSASTIA